MLLGFWTWLHREGTTSATGTAPIRSFVHGSAKVVWPWHAHHVLCRPQIAHVQILEPRSNLTPQMAEWDWTWFGYVARGNSFVAWYRPSHEEGFKKHILSDLLVDETQHIFRNLWTNQQSVPNVPELKICLPSFGCWSAKLVTIQSKHRTWPKANNDGINIDQRWSKIIKALNICKKCKLKALKPHII